MLRSRLATSCLLLIAFGTAHADNACETLAVSHAGTLSVGKDLPKGTDTVGVLLPGGIRHPVWEVKGTVLTISDKSAKSVRAEYDALAPADKPKLRLEIRDSSDKLIGSRCPDYADALPAAAAAAATTGPVAAAAPAIPPGPPGSNQVLPLLPMECEQLVNSEVASTHSHDKYIVFNSTGQLCFQSNPIAQGDLLRVALAVRAGEDRLEAPQGNFQTCSLRAATPTLYGAPAKLPQIVTQGKGTYPADSLIPLTTRRCYDDQLTVSLQTVVDAKPTAGPAVQVQQYKRYQGGVYLGVVSSDLRDGDFGLRSLNGGNVIYNKAPRNRGPSYNVSVVVYGVVRYIQDGLSYPGRDLVNDTGALDRLGFVVAAGLQDPGKRFGLGLSYELIRGINLQVLYEWANTRQLAGYNVGDPFTGTADQIPTHNEWNHTTSVGVSFDFAYVMQLFTRN